MVLLEKEFYADTMWRFYQKGEWRHALDEHWNSGEAGRGLLWPRPLQCDLDFISAAVKKLEKLSIVSIGCGSGLLEWFLNAATGLAVYGIEVDRNYWMQPCWEKRKFINLNFKGDAEFEYFTQSEENALLFCYFNNRTAFRDYIDNYRGNCVIIIGPHKAERFTDPGPFDQEIQDRGWKLYNSKEIGNSKDFIAVFTRERKFKQLF